MCALIAQHGSDLAALAALATLRQHLEAQQNDEQTDSLENPFPHIDVPAEFNQDTLESAHECCIHLQRERCAKQRTKSAGPFETLQERSNHLCQERRTIQQTSAHAQPSFGNDTLQLFGDENTLASGRWDCGEMDTICGFCNAKMWIKERLAKSSYNNPQFSLCCENGKVLLPSLLATLQKLEIFLTSKESSAVKFRDQIHIYNLVLAFTSLGAKVDELITGGPGPYSFRIQGELCHKIESLCPAEG
jgi:hypothetical protein